MRSFTWIVIAGILAGGLPAITGCDDVKESKETVKTKDNGTVVHDKQETREKPDGTIVKEEKHSVDHPDR